MNKKFKIDFANGCANYEYMTKGGKNKISRFTIFTDSMGIKIFTKDGVVFLTEQNSEVL